MKRRCHMRRIIVLADSGSRVDIGRSSVSLRPAGFLLLLDSGKTTDNLVVDQTYYR
jgi:hypothetical protein